MPEAMRALLAALGMLLTGFALANDPALPEAHQAAAGDPPVVRVALVDSGVNYQLEAINSRLARSHDGALIGYDFWDLDELPFDAHPDVRGNIQRHGTRTASVLLREAPFVELVPYRYPRPDMQRMHDLVSHAAEHDVRIIGLPLGGNLRDEWTVFEAAAREHPEILFIISAGNNGRDIDQYPVYPASLNLPNALVVTSADDFGLLAEGVNWGRGSVDYMVPAESVPIIRFDGTSSIAAGSSYAVPRVMALAARFLADDPELSVEDLLSIIRNRFANGVAAQQLKSGFLYDPQYDSKQKIEVSETQQWQAPEIVSQSDLALPLDVMILDDRWSMREVSEVLEGSQTILSNCGIRFADVRLRRVSAPDYLRDLKTGASRTLFEAVRFSGAQRRVAVVFARDTRMSTPFEGEAFGRGNTRARAWLTDSVWLTLALQDRDIALAHELVHVLSNSGSHVQTDGNLMLERTTGSNRGLETAQCELVRSNSLDKGLTNRLNH